jgi:hypothetical protein
MIEPWQAKRIHGALTPTVRYRYRLREREKTGRQGKLYRLVCEAHTALFTLYMDCHYLGCAYSSVFRPSSQEALMCAESGEVRCRLCL